MGGVREPCQGRKGRRLVLGNCSLVTGLGFASEPGASLRSSPLLGEHSAVVTASWAPASLPGGAGKWVLRVTFFLQVCLVF